MDDLRYDVVLTGRALDTRPVSEVARDLAVLFKRDLHIATALLRGTPTTIRTNVDQATATRYIAALTRIGVGANAEPQATLEIDADVIAVLRAEPPALAEAERGTQAPAAFAGKLAPANTHTSAVIASALPLRPWHGLLLVVFLLIMGGDLPALRLAHGLPVVLLGIFLWSALFAGAIHMSNAMYARTATARERFAARDALPLATRRSALTLPSALVVMVFFALSAHFAHRYGGYYSSVFSQALLWSLPAIIATLLWLFLRGAAPLTWAAAVGVGILSLVAIVVVQLSSGVPRGSTVLASSTSATISPVPLPAAPSVTANPTPQQVASGPIALDLNGPLRRDPVIVDLANKTVVYPRLPDLPLSSGSGDSPYMAARSAIFAGRPDLNDGGRLEDSIIAWSLTISVAFRPAGAGGGEVDLPALFLAAKIVAEAKDDGQLCEPGPPDIYSSEERQHINEMARTLVPSGRITYWPRSCRPL